LHKFHRDGEVCREGSLWSTGRGLMLLTGSKMNGLFENPM